MSDPETILVVDDEPAVLGTVARYLEHKGYRVLAAGGSEEAMDLLEKLEGKIQLLLTDVIMPGLSGKDLGILVQKGNPSIPVLYMSGYESEVIAAHGLNLTKINFIQKPFSAVSLVQKIGELLARPKDPLK